MLLAWLVTDWPHTSVAVEVCLRYHRILGISYSFVCVIQIVRRTDPMLGEYVKKKSYSLGVNKNIRSRPFGARLRLEGCPFEECWNHWMTHTIWTMLLVVDDVVGSLDADLPL